MHSDNTLSRPRPSCHLCQHQRGTARLPHKPNGSCVRMESALPFPKDLGIADYRPQRTGGCGTSSPRQVYAEEILHPSYSWGDVRPWDWPLDSPHAPCTCVREVRRDCGCIQRWYYPEHPFNGCYVSPHLKVRGQRYYREVLYVSEQHYRGHEQGDADLQDSYDGHCQRRRVSFQNHEEQLNGPETNRQSGPIKPHCNRTNSGQTSFFPTEVPPSKLGRPRAHGPVLKVNERERREIRTSQGDESLGNHGNQRKSQGTVREQIRQVVTELEEVLGGLKQVQLEMKEVVQQIDVLTDNINLGEDEPRSSSGHWSSWSAAVDSETQSDTTPETSDSSILHHSVSEDSDHINPAVMRNHTISSPLNQRLVTAEINCNAVVQHISEPHRSTANGNCLPHRTLKANGHQNHKGDLENHEHTKSKNHRPPPYPQNGQVKTRTPPCPGKHKTLSSTVV